MAYLERTCKLITQLLVFTALDNYNRDLPVSREDCEQHSCNLVLYVEGLTEHDSSDVLPYVDRWLMFQELKIAALRKKVKEPPFVLSDTPTVLECLRYQHKGYGYV